MPGGAEACTPAEGFRELVNIGQTALLRPV